MEYVLKSVQQKFLTNIWKIEPSYKYRKKLTKYDEALCIRLFWTLLYN